MLKLKQLQPYWMLDSAGGVKNDVEFRTASGDAKPVVVLTAPNAAGKSCLLRSIL